MRLLVSGKAKVISENVWLWQRYIGGLIVPNDGGRPEFYEGLGLEFGADNGAFSGFDEYKYMKMVEKVAASPALMWLVVPDVVGDAKATHELWDTWVPRLDGLPLAYVAQDGLIDLPPVDFDCLFIGGSTEYKLSTGVHRLIKLAKNAGKMVHMGRVNSHKRIELAYSWGCDSVDGSSYSRFSKTHIPKAMEFMNWLHNQEVLF